VVNILHGALIFLHVSVALFKPSIFRYPTAFLLKKKSGPVPLDIKGRISDQVDGIVEEH